ncbi:MAG: DUF2510 domain-containing protein [Acidimicrobiales bacterium]|nr:DUF2510 domain-containing protein [Acidimicrobiales bacterium]
MTDGPASAPPPGWYPDPHTPSMLRWWDGGQWTNDIRPADLAAPSQGSEQGKLRPVGDWMTETFRLLVNNAAALFTLMVVLVIPAALLGGLGFWAGLRDVVFIVDEDPQPGEWPIDVDGLDSIGLLAAAFVLNVVLTLLFSIAGARLAISGRFDPPRNWADALRVGVARLPVVIGWGIVASAIVIGIVIALIVLTALVGVVSAGLAVVVGILVFGVGALVLFGRYGMVFTSPMIAARGSRNPLVVHRITEGATWGLIGRGMLLVLVTAAASLAGSIVTGPLGTLGGSQPIEPDGDIIRLVDVIGGNVGIFLIVQLMNAIVAAVAALIWHVGQGLLFEDLGGEIDPELRV